jgi:hypothetical protein
VRRVAAAQSQCVQNIKFMNLQFHETIFFIFIIYLCTIFTAFSPSLDLDRDACRGMVSGLQPQASSIESGGNGKPYQNLLNISAKNKLIAIYHYMLFDWFLNFSLKQPPWRQGEGGTHF